MDHYFSPSQETPHDLVPVTVVYAGHPMHFDTDAGVFSKGKLDRGTELLIDSLPDLGEKKILDLGCGWGAIGLIIAKLYPNASVHLTDINERAVWLTRRNAKKNKSNVSIHQGDILEHIDETFDVIVTNPPIRAGKKVVYEMISQSYGALVQEGEFFSVVRNKQGAKSYKAELERIFGENVEIINRGSGYKVFHAVKR